MKPRLRPSPEAIVLPTPRDGCRGLETTTQFVETCRARAGERQRYKESGPHGGRVQTYFSNLDPVDGRR